MSCFVVAFYVGRHLERVGMQDIVLSIATAALSLIASAIIIRELLGTGQKPYLWAWVIRLALVAVGFASQAAAGASYSLTMSGMQLLTCAVIIALVIRSRSQSGRLQGAEWGALSAAGVGAAVWVVSGDPLHGLLGVIVADASATVLGIYAAFRKGTQESIGFWLCSLGAATAMAVVVAGSDNIVVMLAPAFSWLNAAVNILAISFVRMYKRRQSSLALEVVEA